MVETRYGVRGEWKRGGTAVKKFALQNTSVHDKNIPPKIADERDDLIARVPGECCIKKASVPGVNKSEEVIINGAKSFLNCAGW